MRAFVFTDKALERYAGWFVWLSVDTENAKNADFLKKYPINVWPTLLVIDPAKERVSLRYAGGATVGQLSKLLDQAQSKTKTPSDDALARVRTRGRGAADGADDDAAARALRVARDGALPAAARHAVGRERRRVRSLVRGRVAGGEQAARGGHRRPGEGHARGARRPEDRHVGRRPLRPI